MVDLGQSEPDFAGEFALSEHFKADDTFNRAKLTDAAEGFTMTLCSTVETEEELIS